jgi:hypothetical protein
MVTVRRVVIVFLGLTALVLAYFVASADTFSVRSGGCNHIPLTAAGRPAYACANQPLP